MQLQKVFSKKAYIDWNATYDYYEKMNVKEAYYLSTEYLQSRALLNAMQGRALLNAIGNLEFSKAYAEALRKLVLNLEYIARQVTSKKSATPRCVFCMHVMSALRMSAILKIMYS
ncbi:hypothetical protein CsSME_00043520 [Camellia sinensis var. sinensis]